MTGRMGNGGSDKVITGEFEALDPEPEEIVVPPPTIGLSLRDRWADMYMTQVLENYLGPLRRQGRDFDAELYWAQAYRFADIGLRARDQTKR